MLLIVSGSLSRDVLPYVHGLNSVDSIFIFCSNRMAHEGVKREYAPKVIDIYTDHDTLRQAVRQQLSLLSEQMMALSFFDQKQKSTKELTKEAASFLWFQIMFNVLIQLPQNTSSKKQMLEKCMEYYRGNSIELENIERFRKTYIADEAIAWYTDECFVYRLLNKALRTEDIDGLYLFRFYIIDLCKQLKEESRKNVGTLTLYRGQVMSDEELDKLKHSVGTLVSINGFFSTTLGQTVATKFLGKSNRDKHQEVLFQITADSSVKDVIFANIEDLSVVKGEHEVLFSVGAVFRIDSVEVDDTLKCWIVKMTVTDEGMVNVKEYIKCIRKENEDATNVVLFGHLLREMGELSKAEKYFNILLQITERNSLAEADIQDQIGHIFNDRSQMKLAFDYYKRSYNIRQNRLPANHMRIAESLNNYAVIHRSMAEYEKAIVYCFQAQLICLINRPNGHLDTATVLSNLANVLLSIGELVMAMKYHIDALEMRLKLLPREHSTVALSFRNVGSVYYLQKEYDSALKQYFYALKIYEKPLPFGHLGASALFSEIVSVYIAKKDYETALNFCDQKVKELHQQVGEAHSSVGRLLCVIGNIHQDKNDDEAAIVQYEKALMIFEKCVPSEQELAKSCYNRIGAICFRKENFAKSLECYMKALEIVQKMCLPENPEVVQALRNVGSVHLKLKDYKKSIEYLEDALKISREKDFPDEKDKQITQILLNEARMSLINEINTS